MLIISSESKNGSNVYFGPISLMALNIRKIMIFKETQLSKNPR